PNSAILSKTPTLLPPAKVRFASAGRGRIPPAPVPGEARRRAPQPTTGVRRLTGSSPFYREKLAGAGVAIDAEVGLDDLASLPFTVKQDLWDHYPWGMLTIPREQVVRVHASSGTGGRPSLVGYSRGDVAMWAEVNARALGCASAVP